MLPRSNATEQFDGYFDHSLTTVRVPFCPRCMTPAAEYTAYHRRVRDGIEILAGGTLEDVGISFTWECAECGMGVRLHGRSGHDPVQYEEGKSVWMASESDARDRVYARRESAVKARMRRGQPAWDDEARARLQVLEEEERAASSEPTRRFVAITIENGEWICRYEGPYTEAERAERVARCERAGFRAVFDDVADDNAAAPESATDDVRPSPPEG